MSVIAGSNPSISLTLIAEFDTAAARKSSKDMCMTGIPVTVGIPVPDAHCISYLMKLSLQMKNKLISRFNHNLQNFLKNSQPIEFVVALLQLAELLS